MDQVLSSIRSNPVDKSIKMDKIISPECVVFLDGKSKKEVISELVAVLHKEQRLADADKCLADVLAREEVVTTCMPGGIALPHGRSEGANDLVSAIGISKEGVMCDAPDGNLTHVFVLSICPKDANAPYLRYMAQVAKVLDTDGNIEAIRQMNNTSVIREMFVNKRKGN
jgi:mannitol/fructose-specific phosphotransferase system IIA component (Ntr-type)